jgi:3-hydroxyisobutyrate dehydrogenase-like beta-hydroxyacid dehydrogenase
MTRVGVVGAGKMGSALARNLLAHGHTVSVWDRSREAADAVVAAGATAPPSLRSLVEGAETVIVMLWGDDAAREVSLAQVIPAARPGQLVVEMSTLSPAMYEILESVARARGVAFLAAPVLGSVNVAQAGQLTILPGGDRAAFDRARPLFESLGSTVSYTGSVRASGYLKLANNVILGVSAETLGELLSLCERAGVDRRMAIETLTGTFGRAAASKTEQLLNADSAPRFSLDALLKDLELAHRSADALGAAMPVLDTILPEVRRTAARGLGDRDYIVAALQPDGAPTGAVPMEG